MCVCSERFKNHENRVDVIYEYLRLILAMYEFYYYFMVLGPSIIVRKLKVQNGWKPGAVSKRLLHMLNKAKSRRLAVEEIKQKRRVKKLLEDKPTLKISKKEGQYCVELQPDSYKPEESNNQYTPLIYKIESENNEAKIKKRTRLQKRLTRAAVKEVWSDPQKENCKKTCLRAYSEAIGVMSVDKDNIEQEEVDTIDSCSCQDEEVSSSCTSSDIDFELYFTPPIMRYKTSERVASNLFVV